MLARSAGIKILYQGIDITTDLIKDLLSFKYTDNAADNADDVEITLKDKSGKWLNNWWPEKGDSLTVEINTTNWRKDGDSQTLPCGSFIVDEPEYTGRPRVMTLKGISTPSNTNFTTTKKSKAWEQINLKTIAQDIADNAGLNLFFDSSINPTYDRKDQSDTSDMAFLADLCKSEGISFKVTDHTIVLFNEADYENRPSICTLVEDGGLVNSYNLKTSLTNTAYAGCQVTYYDANKGRLIDYLFSIKDDIDPAKDKVYVENTRVNSLEEAQRLAQKKLRELNKKEFSVTMNVVGDVRLIGGVCVDISGFGKFDGKYFIDKAAHNQPSYTVDLEMHRVLEGY
ncbi:contractile injection system protein, VgrG/Pvc8 family [Desulfosporosinus sp. FKB]|uniref:phage late control D family protein n=1 Tax=Desulfosporosinus sp. FKB TaxID=1969835 RepID=UPI0014829744|nr:contractile injection system protein, VgrG/Pvc8 family [Desulfosporosinus sp. FKB]